MVMVMAITITTEARKLKSNNKERVLLYGQKQHLCVGMIYFMMYDSVDEVGDPRECFLRNWRCGL